MNNVGKIIYGFGEGYFCADFPTEPKVIVFETDTSICCKVLDTSTWQNMGWITCANFDSASEKQQFIDRNSIEDDEGWQIDTTDMDINDLSDFDPYKGVF